MSSLFTSAQLRAARALLNWSRSELAHQACVSEQTIHRLENGLNAPEAKTQQLILRTLERAGVEFQGYEGVRYKPEDVRVFNGDEGLVEFFDNVYEHISRHGGLVRQIGIDEPVFTKHLGEHSQKHIDRMTHLARTNPQIPKQRAIIRESDYNLECSAYTAYRWYPKKQFSCVPFYVYGDVLGIMNFHQDTLKIIYIRSSVIAEAYSIQFDDIWDRSKIPAKTRLR